MAAGRGGGGLGPSNGAAAPRALLLIVVAVLLGAALLWKGLDDGTDLVSDQPVPTTTATTGDGTPDNGTGDGTPDDGTGGTTTSTLFPTITEPPSEVQVLVANGSGTARAAGSVTELLVPKGYATLAPANAQPTDSTMIFFRPGMVAEARAVMELLAPDSPDLLAQIPPTGLAVAENALDRLESADIVVILGADGRIHNG
ncbi:MAG: LytR C-terminal domain-containing protein [Acidimicrobiales bacterium]|nr:LytR C-terminal domain-containing protein [Acidimicrobiales bacterium]